MTLIASWVSADDKRKGKKISAIYFCSDSRYTWSVRENAQRIKFNEGPKVFGCTNSPEIFCYCGDVQFPVYTITPLLSEIDRGVLFKADDSIEEKESRIYSYFEKKLEDYPPAVLTQNFSIYYATCIHYRFYAIKYNYYQRTLTLENIPLPNESTKIFHDGSGSKVFADAWTRRDNDKVNEHKTSRNVYRCMIEAIDSGVDEKTGGCPQLIGLYRNGQVQPYGIIRNRRRYFQGREVDDSIQLDNIEWRNDNFERMNPHTMKLLIGAQPQPFAF